MNRTWSSKSAEGMPTRTFDCDAPALRTYRPMRNMSQVTINSNDRRQIVPISLNSGTRASQVAKTFLANIGDGHQIKLCLLSHLIQHIQNSQHGSHTQAVIPNTWPSQDIPIAHNIQRCRKREYCIEM